MLTQPYNLVVFKMNRIVKHQANNVTHQCHNAFGWCKYYTNNIQYAVAYKATKKYIKGDYVYIILWCTMYASLSLQAKATPVF